MDQRKIAVVTGAGSGIGRNAALALAKRDFAVVLAGRNEQTLKETAALAGSAQTLAIATDVSKPDSVAQLFEKTKAAFGRVDVLFNNAGTSAPPVPFEDLTAQQWDAVVAVNLTGAFLVAQAAYRVMKEQTPQGGRIINNGSISAQVPRPNSAPYTATKHAITGLTKSLSLDGRKYNIACGQIDIGNAATTMVNKISTGVIQGNGSLLAEPTMPVDHVGEAIAYMAGLPLETNVQFMTVMATAMPYIGRG
jgi:NAD(P)-dependent dehydrogenase (short-subunit alcohol dehydrogenase family)